MIHNRQIFGINSLMLGKEKVCHKLYLFNSSVCMCHRCACIQNSVFKKNTEPLYDHSYVCSSVPAVFQENYGIKLKVSRVMNTIDPHIYKLKVIHIYYLLKIHT